MEDDNEEDFEEYDMEESLNDPHTSEKIVEKSVKQHDANVVVQQDSDFQRELTEKYISGQMSFTEYIKQVDADEEDDEEEETKGCLISEGILTMVPLPAKRAKSLLQAKNLNELFTVMVGKFNFKCSARIVIWQLL